MPHSKKHEWRHTLGNLLLFLFIALGLVLAGFWAYFIWHIDWVHAFGSMSHRQRNWNFGFVMLVCGTVLIFALATLAGGHIALSIQRPTNKRSDAPASQSEDERS
jgi:hypothetical protein